MENPTRGVWALPDGFVRANGNKQCRDGEKMVDPFGHNRGFFRYGAILRTIKSLARSMEELASPEADSKEGKRESGSSERKSEGSTEGAAVVGEAYVTGDPHEPSPGAVAELPSVGVGKPAPHRA